MYIDVDRIWTLETWKLVSGKRIIISTKTIIMLFIKGFLNYHMVKY
jgi:hypothetical protein